MSLNIVETVVGNLSTDQVAALAKVTGGDAERARAAASAGVASIVDHLVERSSSVTGAHNLLTMFRSQLPTSTLAAKLLADGEDDLADSIASFSSVPRSAGPGIVAIVLPGVVEAVRREVIGKQLAADGLAAELGSMQEAVWDGGVVARARPIAVPRHDVRIDLVPPPVLDTDTERSEPPSIAVPSRPRSQGWLFAAVILGALGIFALILWARGQTEKMTREIDSPSTATITGAELRSGEVLSRDFARTDGPDRFALSDIQFVTGGTRLVSGLPTIERVAELMKEHPSTRVRIEGMTEVVREPRAVNILGVGRALAVKQLLVARGIDPRRIETAGRGVASSSVDDATVRTATSRRIDLVITQR